MRETDARDFRSTSSRPLNVQSHFFRAWHFDSPQNILTKVRSQHILRYNDVVSGRSDSLFQKPVSGV